MDGEAWLSDNIDYMADPFRNWPSSDSVHPDAPAGGSGPGFSRVHGPLQGSPFSTVPSVGSPSGRHVEWPRTSVVSLQMMPVDDEPPSGKIPASLGLGSVTRIPVPGTKGLGIELNPRGWEPKGGSTSSLFIQDLTGKPHLRLDYGFNKTSGMKEWHWNQKGTADVFGITNHTSAGTAEQVLGSTAKVYKYAGRTLLVIGLAADAYSIVVSAAAPLASGGFGLGPRRGRM